MTLDNNLKVKNKVKGNIDGEHDDDSVTHFEDYANGIDDECPDLEEIGNGIKEEEDHDGLDGFRINPEPYGEKTIDEDDMEAYFNGNNQIQVSI